MYVRLTDPAFRLNHKISVWFITSLTLNKEFFFFRWHIVFVGHAVAQLVEALRYKPEGRGFDSRWCHYYFSLTNSFRPHYVPAVDSASNRNKHQEYFLRAKAAGA